jgi:hypothetical protein
VLGKLVVTENKIFVFSGCIGGEKRGRGICVCRNTIEEHIGKLFNQSEEKYTLFGNFIVRIGKERVTQ